MKKLYHIVAEIRINGTEETQILLSSSNIETVITKFKAINKKHQFFVSSVIEQFDATGVSSFLNNELRWTDGKYSNEFKLIVVEGCTESCAETDEKTECRDSVFKEEDILLSIIELIGGELRFVHDFANPEMKGRSI
ncbi:MAG: hypothetical protein RRZ64_06505 [Rikenellaceae bacterium]